MVKPKANKILIIAEAGVNHNGDIKIAKKLIEAAAEAGADLIKFQTFDANKIVTKTAKKALYQLKGDEKSLNQFSMLKKLQLTKRQHKVLINHCKKKNINFFSSAFDIESLNYLASIDLEYFKVPSGEITNLPYLLHVGSFGKPIILSTGMATLGEIEESIKALEFAGLEREKITLLHCNTEYPTPISDVNLLAMVNMRETFGVKVGYSDHTMGIEIAIAAAALGAEVIEKHLTLDRNLSGPDHEASILPEEFALMVRSIRNIELSLGDGIKKPSSSELKNKSVVRKSLVASKTIRKGEIFSESNLAIKRPGLGMSPMRWFEVIGKVAGRDFGVDDLIEL